MTEAPEPLFHVVDLFDYEDFVQRTMRDRKSIVFLMDLMYERCFDYLTQVLESGAHDVFGVTIDRSIFLVDATLTPLQV